MNLGREDSARDRQLEEILHIYLQTVDAGKPLDRNDLVREHPEFASELGAFFEDQDAVAHLAQGLAEQAAPCPNPAEAATLGPSPAPAPSARARVHYFGDYELIDEIARGGMGVVYRARQASLNRIVALKMILAGQLASPDDVARFHREAEAAANLDHPNIVPIYEVGEHEGQHYFSMKLIDGGSLTQVGASGKWIAGSKEGQKKAAELVAAIARAIHHAHQRGILHRDLKPANILIDAQGQPNVTDFGLAKRVEGDVGLSRTGSIVGTPSYMPPEQARSEKVLTTGVDIYSAGAILYELLTGRPPFQAETALDIVLQVIELEPKRPRLLRPSIDPDLETICLKCLEKEPAKRYVSAASLADDLERWLAGEPIQARRAHVGERAMKWAARRPAIAALLALVVVTSAAGFGLVTWKWRDAIAQKQDAFEQRSAAESLSAALTTTLAKSERTAYAARLALASREWTDNNIDHYEDLLDECPEKLRGWEWSYLRRLGRAEKLTIRDSSLMFLSLQWSADGKRLLALATDHGKVDTVRVWDATNGSSVLATAEAGRYGTGPFAVGACAAISPDGRYVAVHIPDKSPVILDGKTGKGLRNLGESRQEIRNLAFSADGERLAASMPAGGLAHLNTFSLLAKAAEDPALNIFGRAIMRGLALFLTARLVIDQTAGDEICIWESKSGKLLATFRAQDVTDLALSPNGTQLATAHYDEDAVRLWNIATAKEIVEQGKSIQNVRRVAFAPDGSTLVSFTGRYTEMGEATLWHLPSGRKVLTSQCYFPLFQPDGKRVALLTDAGIKVYATANGSQELVLHGAGDAVAFSTDGRMIATRGSGHAIIVCDSLSGKELHAFRGIDSGRVFELAFSPDGKCLAAIGFSSVIKVWDLGIDQDARHLRGHETGIHHLAFHDDGRSLVSGGADQILKNWDTTTWLERYTVVGHEGGINSVAYSSDGIHVVSASGQNYPWDRKPSHIISREASTGKQIATFHGHKGLVRGLALSPDGKYLAAISNYSEGQNNFTPSLGELKIWDVQSRQEVLTITSPTRETFECIGYSPDGRQVAAGGFGSLRVWHASTGRAISTNNGGVYALAFHPDGSRIATAGTDAWLHILDVTTGDNLLDMQGHTKETRGVTFSPDGTRLASASYDNTVKLWDAASGQEMLSLRGDAAFESVAFSPAGDRLAAGCGGTIYIWESASGEEPRTLRKHVRKIGSVAYSPHGTRLLTTGAEDRSVRLWSGETGEDLFVARARYGAFTSAVFSPDGDSFAVAGGEFQKAGELRIFDAKTQHEILALVDLKDTVRGLAYSPDGRLLAACSSKEIHIWNAANGQELRVLQAPLASSLAFHPDGRRLASGGGSDDVGELIVWNLENGQQMQRLAGHTQMVMGVAYSPDGKYLCSASRDGTARIWDANSGSLLHILRGHREAVTCVAFYPGGRFVATAGFDATVRLWDVLTGLEVSTLSGHPFHVWSLAFRPDGKRLVTAGSPSGLPRPGVIKIWDVSRLQSK